jgi:RimJ/RimL family protein N-acetyltransferase
MTDHAFTVLGFKKLSAPVLMPNKASMRVLEKCGYELEGVLKLDIFKDNEFHDIHYYAKLPE